MVQSIPMEIVYSDQDPVVIMALEEEVDDYSGEVVDEHWYIYVDGLFYAHVFNEHDAYETAKEAVLDYEGDQ